MKTYEKKIKVMDFVKAWDGPKEPSKIHCSYGFVIKIDQLAHHFPFTVSDNCKELEYKRIYEHARLMTLPKKIKFF